MMELETLCASRTCSVSVRDLQFAPDGLERIESAWNFVVKFLQPLRHDATLAEFDDDDFHSLAQLSPQAAIGLPSQPNKSEAFSFGSHLDAAAPDFDPSRPSIWQYPPAILELHQIWRNSAIPWENECPAAQFMVWFLCPGAGGRVCQRGRRVALFADFTEWQERLQFVWRDSVINTIPVEINVVQPHPHVPGSDISAHVLLTQLVPDQDAGVLVTIHDQVINEGFLFHIAVTVPRTVQLSHLVSTTGFAQEGAMFSAQLGGDFLDPTGTLRARTGHGFLLHVSRDHLPVDWDPPFLPDVPHAEGMGLLQTKLSMLKRSTCERLTHGQVAHTHGPQVDTTAVSATSRISVSLATSLTRAIALTSGDSSLDLPHFLEVPWNVTNDIIQQELACFGLDCKAFLFGDHDHALCVPSNWMPTGGFHVMFANVDLKDQQGTFMHSFSAPWTEIALMQVLHKLGYEKAFVLQVKPMIERVTLVIFGESHAISTEPSPYSRPQRPWPVRQNRATHAPLFVPVDAPEPACLLGLGLEQADLCSFFDPGNSTLCADFVGFELPEISQYAIEALHPGKPLEELDRLIIYVDGSSQPSQKHLPPLRVDLEGIPDAWAFIVLGETYTPDGGSELSLQGWQSQQVRYDPSSPYYAGAEKTASFLAEREGLFFAALWRAEQNCNLPTVFRSDSQLACVQAQGLVGSAHLDRSFQLLRGIFQFLDACLGPDNLIIEHIYGHNGDPWNEATDLLAKNEARSSHFLPRQGIDLRKWGDAIPFLWMLAGEQFGCPHFCGNGFDVGPPDLPPERPPSADEIGEPPCQEEYLDLDFRVSFASANVSTLGIGSRGHAGKLDYVKGQFKTFGLNFLGIQESRTEEGMICRDGILRLCSGAAHKHLGVELWCNLEQPIAHFGNVPCFLQQKDFQVLHRDPRCLLVQVSLDDWQAYLLVGHAPHSGFSLAERTTWWDQLSQRLGDCLPDVPLFAMLDANASPGTCDHRTVLGPVGYASSGTPLLRDFLASHSLCLPSTSALHQGPLHTWTSPDGDGHHMIDFVAIPQQFFAFL